MLWILRLVYQALWGSDNVPLNPEPPQPPPEDQPNAQLVAPDNDKPPRSAKGDGVQDLSSTTSSEIRGSLTVSDSSENRHEDSSASGPEFVPGQRTRRSESGERSSAPTARPALRMHGMSVRKYRSVYRTVVEPAVHSPQQGSSRVATRKVKERLWGALNHPQLKEVVHEDGQVEVRETFGPSSPGRRVTRARSSTSPEPQLH